jgi:hypothetical protein
VLLAIVYLLLGFVPPLITGPLAGLAFVSIVRRGKAWHQIPFWVFVTAANLLIAYWIATADEWLPGPTFSTCLFSPFASTLALILVLRARRGLRKATPMDGPRERWLLAGSLLIPILQLAPLIVLWGIGPALCQLGLVACQQW